MERERKKKHDFLKGEKLSRTQIDEGFFVFWQQKHVFEVVLSLSKWNTSSGRSPVASEFGALRLRGVLQLWHLKEVDSLLGLRIRIV